MEIYNLVSFVGIWGLLLLAWAFSTNRTVINWRVIGWGLLLQAGFALFIFVVPAGASFGLLINSLVVKVLESATAGSQFLFGRLALPPGTTNTQGETSLGFFLAFQALPTVVFFAALMQALYYLRIMPWIIRAFASVFTRFLRISGAESLCAASNIFVGIEAALTIRPYLPTLTRSELCTILTAGMATIASSVMALYVFILQPQFPLIAGHLVSASLLSAPAAIIMAKLLVPETETPVTLGVNITPCYEREGSLTEAIIQGANAGLRLVAGIVALLLAFLGLIALLDLLIGVPGTWINQMLGVEIDWSLRGLLGYLFYPLTLLVGVPPADALEIARIIGERAVATEVQGYQDLSRLLAAGLLQHPRSAVIGVYALTGFAHVASLAIFVGGIAALAPSRTKDLAALGPRALLAATLACLLTAAVAGTFFQNTSLLFP
ncbi:MAG: nucleoside transporter [Nitrospinota bacterium]|nr:MAG: nucleoside transporter [Nitrospinota bacterium]